MVWTAGWARIWKGDRVSFLGKYLEGRKSSLYESPSPSSEKGLSKVDRRAISVQREVKAMGRYGRR